MLHKFHENTCAIITGSASGNGLAIYNVFKKSGIKVIGIDKSKSSNSVKFNGNVADNKLIKQVYNYCTKQKISSLIIVNNAGITLPKKGSYPLSYWDKTLNINLTAPFMWIEAFIPLFKKIKNGSIINITSLGAENAFPDNPSYIASKGGLKTLTKYYAQLLGNYNIRANNVGPGYIKTPMTKKSYSDIKRRKLISNHTFFNKWGESTDVANLCLFLASDSSNYITGQDIYVDGGWLTKGIIG